MDGCLAFCGLILAIIIIVIYEIKLRKPRNDVHFYVARDEDKELWLYLGKPIRMSRNFTHKKGRIITNSYGFKYLGLNIDDYKDLKWEDEPVEVFLNLED